MEALLCFGAGLVEPVQIVLYGESLCPSCKYFVESVVAPLYDEGLNKDLFRFRYLAYGNARNQSDVSTSNLQSLSRQTRRACSATRLSSSPASERQALHACVWICRQQPWWHLARHTAALAKHACADEYRVPQGVIVCQHGPDECSLNQVINCAQRLYPRQVPCDKLPCDYRP